jgi:tRNA threonylcarbamoyladenosine biosynthesis protein TsaE
LAAAAARGGAPVTLALPGLAATEALGRALAPRLVPGDAVLLSGGLGAGKSALARAVVRARLEDPQAQVPSPSYTIVNAYEAAGLRLWHVDLYRLADPSELAELGLEEAFAQAITLLEWPERLPAPPPRRLEIALALPAGAEPGPEGAPDGVMDEPREARIACHGSWPRLAEPAP